MSKVNLQSVLDNLINEDTDKATEILHQWFLEACADINNNILREEVHVHVHSDAPDLATEDENALENLSPINGSQSMDTDGDTVEVTSDDDSGDDDDSMFANDDDGDDNDNDDSNLEDDVDELKAELEALKAELASQLGLDLDALEDGDDDQEVEFSVDDDDNDDDSDKSDDDESEEDDEDKDNVFDDLDESFELEKVNEPDMTSPLYVGAAGKVKDAMNNKSPALHDGPDINAAHPVEIESTEYTGTDRQPSPDVKALPLRKNQVKSAADELEKVPSMGPKSSLLANNKDLYPENKDKGSLIGTRDMRK